MRAPGSQRTAPEEPPALQDHAYADLRYIRETLERTGSFTAVPGLGTMLVGTTALGAALLAANQASPERWLAVWLAELVLAVAISGFAIRAKSRRIGLPMSTGPARRFALGFSLPVLAGAVLTVALLRADLWQALPGAWLLLYGVAIVAGWGGLSLEVVPAMGLSFALAGTLALLGPPGWGQVLLGFGFGGLHLLFGFVIARRYGG